MEDKLRERLNEHHSWPAVFPFKFIIANNQELLDQVRALFSKEADVKTRPSKNGNYIAITGKEVMMSADSVIEVYQKAQKIEGIIAL